MKLSEYQGRAAKTNQYPKEKALEQASNLILTKAVSISKLLAIGSQDEDIFTENLGDLLWYLSSIATHHNLSLDLIAQKNLEKAESRYGSKIGEAGFFDDNFPPHQQLPRVITFIVREIGSNDPKGKVMLSVPLREGGEMQIGDTVTDNSYNDDGYRYHDTMHMAYMAVLRWSPVLRALLRRKRKNDPQLDEVEDGARGVNVEEAMTEAIFTLSAPRNGFFRDTKSVPHEVIEMAMNFTERLDVKECNGDLWEKALLKGYEIFHLVRANKGGYVDVDMNARTLHFRPFES